jgi:hypothetical protein
MGMGFGCCSLPHGSGSPDPVRVGCFPPRSAAFPLSGATRFHARGINVGANAYIVKSSFDQSDLLEVIGRLL